MFCPRCGAHNVDEAINCQRCGQVLQAPGAPPVLPYRSAQTTRVPSYLAQAIIVTILCCWPLGIPAIVYAAQSMSRQSAGDYAGALVASNKARRWCWIAFGAGMAFVAIWAVAAVLDALF